MVLGADEDYPSLAFLSSSFLRVAASLTLCLATSISANTNDEYWNKLWP